MDAILFRHVGVRWVLVWLWVSAGFSWLAQDVPVARAAETPTCDTLQVMMVIDDSPSMTRSDPQRLRQYGSLNIADILAQTYLSAPVDPAHGRLAKRLQLAVIYFGNASDERLSWTTIAGR